ncbi:MAG: UDP-N-acetylmuramoyl-L-alanine--D-glutamate ligase [Bacteriovoracales bacterium]|nr:UDP-N-acetylmuramoyl-L-alanine--D-glutamate ligase [Bacteriovoracales bacterium]
MRMKAELSGKSVAVMGAGICGISMVKALKGLGVDTVLYSDGPPESWASYRAARSLLPRQKLKDGRREHLAGKDLLCKSPGVPGHHPLVKEAQEKNIPIWTDANLAYHFCEAPIMAVTGTNGKTTTVLMLQKLLQREGFEVFCGGNIGRPCADSILGAFDIYLFELSSFQLEYCPHFRADYSAITNISPNHEERYETFSLYKKAKYNLFQNRRDEDFHLIPEKLKLEDDPPFPVRAYTPKEVEDFKACYDWTRFQLQGPFNQENLFTAHTLAEAFLKNSSPKASSHLKTKTQDLIDTFSPPPHRLEPLGRWRGLNLYNDSKSTNGLSTLKALESFSDSGPIYLIFGGQMRRKYQHYGPHLQKLHLQKLKSKCKKIFLIGESAGLLHSKLGGVSLLLDTLENVKEYLEKNDLSGTLLFSPGLPSFDRYADYKERGNHFKEIFSPSS